MVTAEDSYSVPTTGHIEITQQTPPVQECTTHHSCTEDLQSIEMMVLTNLRVTMEAFMSETTAKEQTNCNLRRGTLV